MAGVCALLPARGGFVGRAFTPAAWGLAAAQGLRDDAGIVPYGCGARSCRALQDISAAKRQCTPPSAPCGASTSPCRGGFIGGSPPKASPARGGVASGDGGVRHLAVPIPFRGDLRRRTGSRRAKSPALHRARWRAAAQERRPQVRADGGPVQGSPPCPGGGGLPFPVPLPVCPVL